MLYFTFVVSTIRVKLYTALFVAPTVLEIAVALMSLAVQTAQPVSTVMAARAILIAAVLMVVAVPVWPSCRIYVPRWSCRPRWLW